MDDPKLLLRKTHSSAGGRQENAQTLLCGACAETGYQAVPVGGPPADMSRLSPCGASMSVTLLLGSGLRDRDGLAPLGRPSI